MSTMMPDVFMLVLVAVAALPVAVLAGEIAASRSSYAYAAAGSPQEASADAPPFLVLIPAHDESAVLEATLASIQAQLRPQDRVLVVADNCSDDTARIARSMGAEVTERHDLGRRGKGYALAHGVEHIARGPAPAVVIVVDADCLLASHALGRLAAAAMRSGRPVQALYLMEASGKEATGAEQVSLFAWRVKNWLRPSGTQALGWPCMLTGSGMALPWNLLAQADLAHGGVVEDMQLGIELTKQGSPPMFMESALVTSTLAATSAARSTQRTRWESGHLSQIRKQAPSLLRNALRPGHGRASSLLLLDLLVPPVALLTLCVASVTGLALVLAGLNVTTSTPAWLATAVLGVLSVAVLTAWLRCGRDLIPPSRLPSLLWYASMKIPHYAAILVRRGGGWVKTTRGH